MIQSIKKKIKQILKPGIKVKLYKIPGKLEKLGSEYGGWIIPVNSISSDSVCYLAGAGEDISFDMAVANRFHCPVYIFDPTPRSKIHFEKVIEAAKSGEKVPVNNDTNSFYEPGEDAVQYVQFFELGIWKESTYIKFYAPENESHISHSISNLQHTSKYFEARVERLSEIMKANQHTTIDILKLDIEGAEYEVIDTILEDKLDIKILCVEFHPSGENGYEPAKSCIRKLEKNNYGVIAKENLDFTFINKGIYK